MHSATSLFVIPTMLIHPSGNMVCADNLYGNGCSPISHFYNNSPSLATYATTTRAFKPSQTTFPTGIEQISSDFSTSSEKSASSLLFDTPVGNTSPAFKQQFQVFPVEEDNINRGFNNSNQPNREGRPVEHESCVSISTCAESCVYSIDNNTTASSATQVSTTVQPNTQDNQHCLTVPSCVDSCIDSERGLSQQPSSSKNDILSQQPSSSRYDSPSRQPNYSTRESGIRGTKASCSCGSPFTSRNSSKPKRRRRDLSLCLDTQTCEDSCVLKRPTQQDTSCDITPSCADSCVESVRRRPKGTSDSAECRGNPSCTRSCVRNDAPDACESLRYELSGPGKQPPRNVSFRPTGQNPQNFRSQSPRRLNKGESDPFSKSPNNTTVNKNYPASQYLGESYDHYDPQRFSTRSRQRNQSSNRSTRPHNASECCPDDPRSCRGVTRHSRSCAANLALLSPCCPQIYQKRFDKRPPWDSGDGPSQATLRARARAAVRAMKARRYSKEVSKRNGIPNSSNIGPDECPACKNEDEDSDEYSRSCNGVTRHDSSCIAYAEFLASHARVAEYENSRPSLTEENDQELTVLNVHAISYLQNTEREQSLNKSCIEEDLDDLENAQIFSDVGKLTCNISKPEYEVVCTCSTFDDTLNSNGITKGALNDIQTEEEENGDRTRCPCTFCNNIPSTGKYESCYDKRVLKSLTRRTSKFSSISRKLSSALSNAPYHKKDRYKKRCFKFETNKSNDLCSNKIPHENLGTDDTVYCLSNVGQNNIVESSVFCENIPTESGEIEYPYSTNMYYVSTNNQSSNANELHTSQHCKNYNPNHIFPNCLHRKELHNESNDGLIFEPTKMDMNSTSRPLKIKKKTSRDICRDENNQELLSYERNNGSAMTPGELKLNDPMQKVFDSAKVPIICNYCLDYVNTPIFNNTGTNQSHNPTYNQNSVITQETEIRHSALQITHSDQELQINPEDAEFNNMSLNILSDPSYSRLPEIDQDISKSRDANFHMKVVAYTDDVQTSTSHLHVANELYKKRRKKRRANDRRNSSHKYKRNTPHLSSSNGSNEWEEKRRHVFKDKDVMGKHKVKRVRNAACTARIGPKYKIIPVSQICTSIPEANPVYMSSCYPIYDSVSATPQYLQLPVTQHIEVPDFNVYQRDIVAAIYPKTTTSDSVQTEPPPSFEKNNLTNSIKETPKKVISDTGLLQDVTKSKTNFSSQTPHLPKRTLERATSTNETRETVFNSRGANNYTQSKQDTKGNKYNTVIESNNAFSGKHGISPKCRENCEHLKESDQKSRRSEGVKLKKSNNRTRRENLEEKPARHKIKTVNAYQKSKTNGNNRYVKNNTNKELTENVLVKTLSSSHPSKIPEVLDGKDNNSSTLLESGVKNKQKTTCNEQGNGHYSLPCRGKSAIEDMKSKTVIDKLGETPELPEHSEKQDSKPRTWKSTADLYFSEDNTCEDRKTSSVSAQVATDDLFKTREYGTSTFHDQKCSPHRFHNKTPLPRRSLRNVLNKQGITNTKQKPKPLSGRKRITHHIKKR